MNISRLLVQCVGLFDRICLTGRYVNRVDLALEVVIKCKTLVDGLDYLLNKGIDGSSELGDPRALSCIELLGRKPFVATDLNNSSLGWK